MQKYLLNKNWEYVEAGLQNPLLVGLLSGWKKTDLPHDYAVEKGRDRQSAAGLDEGFFQGAGLYYKKSFVWKEAAAGKQAWLEFEGISGVAEIWINKKFVTKHMNPYTGICVEVTQWLQPGENEITLHVDSRMKPNSRWYVGTGLYRNVWLHVGQANAVKPHGLKAHTVSLSDRSAVLAVKVALIGKAKQVKYRLLDADGQVAAEVTGGIEEMLPVEQPRAWTPDVPYLYTLQAVVYGDNGEEDIDEERIGLRTVEVDAKQGFLLNGVPLKLKGGCIHHDLGLLGAADHKAAELRRIRILKKSGFNAVRLAHNPFGPAIFEACDELGMLCVEEAFDEWVLGRTSFGLHITFEDRWEKDLEDMVERDYNHPSIVMWSTGNEVEERDGSADGFVWAKRLADKVRSLDTTRPVSASACALFSEYGQRPATGTTGNQALNMAYDAFAEGRDIWGPATAQYFAPLDVAGYNYKDVRYAHDGKQFPGRLIYGSESYPRAAFRTWKSTLENSHVIGDFVWTAWDYLGEVGVGRWEASDADRPSDPAWPWMTAACSDIDLIGHKRPQSYYRDVLWGIGEGPKVFCLPPDLTDRHIARLSWGWEPVERNYAFPGLEGIPMDVHVYADADEVELFVNGKSAGVQPCGKQEEYRTVFRILYEPGTLLAVGRRGGTETGRDLLTTAGKIAGLRLQPEMPDLTADGRDLCFVEIQAQDSTGVPVFSGEETVSVCVENGELVALGNADPKPDRVYPFSEAQCPLYQGRAMAIVRSCSEKEVCKLTVCTESGVGQTLEIALRQPMKKEDPYVGEPSGNRAVDLTLGTLMENETARNLLQQFMGAMLTNNPMLETMKGMSLKKLLGMGGMPIPESLSEALDQAMQI